MDTESNQIASAWLSQLSYSLEQKDAASCASLFHHNGWLRDLLVFTWNLRTLNGHGQILDYLSSNMESTTISELEINLQDVYFRPSPGDLPGSVSSGFTFSTPIANGRGLFTLTRAASEPEVWRAFTLLVSLDSLKGHEPIGAEQGVYHGNSLCWSEVREQRARIIEANPHVLIVLFQPYPETWPRYTPRDKVADWLEQYAVSQDLVVWMKSQLLPTPSFDENKKEWAVSIDRDGQIITINPKHIILATGTLGGPYTPVIQGRDLFKGQILHSDDYTGGPQFNGKRVVVVGTGNSGADIALDLHVRGAQSVTLLQRSVTCVQASETVNGITDQLWRPDVPTEVADYRRAGTPFKLMKQMLREQKDLYWEKDKHILEGLAKAGMKVNLGPDGSGVFPLVYERFGGMDVGCADHIIAGEIKVKSGLGVKRFLEHGLLFDDDTILDADFVVFATGFVNIQSVMKGIFGEIIDKAGPVGGVDEEGEMKGAYRPTGYPGLWYAPGDFQISRFGSRLLVSPFIILSFLCSNYRLEGNPVAGNRVRLHETGYLDQIVE
ncbi:hypothetical protein HHX47_DHR1000063 [Lentinula edodes]|nr:hypothetical protein HHX47_DHR1000063 [Lentinula edodes]